MNEKDTSEIKKLIEERINQKFPNFSEEYQKLTTKVGEPLIKSIKESFKGFFDNELNSMTLSVIVDANFIVGQIKGSVENNRPIEQSFIYKLCSSGIFKVYTPPKVLIEIDRHIPRLIPNEVEKGKLYAKKILHFISIEEAYWVEDWKKANRLIGSQDKDDIPFLALAFHKNSHAILTNDNHFKLQQNVKIWDIGHTKNIVTTSQRGFLSFMVLGVGIESIHVLWEILCIVFSTIFDLLLMFIEGIYAFIKGGINALSKIPNEIYITSGIIILLLAIFSEDFRNGVTDFTSKMLDKLSILIEKIGEGIKDLIVAISHIVELLKPYAITFFEFAGYFLFEFSLAYEELMKIDKLRANSQYF